MQPGCLALCGTVRTHCGFYVNLGFFVRTLTSVDNLHVGRVKERTYSYPFSCCLKLVEVNFWTLGCWHLHSHDSRSAVLSLSLQTPPVASSGPGLPLGFPLGPRHTPNRRTLQELGPAASHGL